MAATDSVQSHPNFNPYNLLGRRPGLAAGRFDLVRQMLLCMVMKEAADELTFTPFRSSLNRSAYGIGPLHRLS
jgi:hypothetical protein